MQRFIESLEERRHFAIFLTVPPLAGTDTYFIAGDGANDTATVFMTPAPAGSRYPFNFTCAEIPGSTRNAGDVQVYLYGGGDTIHLIDLPFGRASGGGGMDDVTLENCTGVGVSVWSPNEGTPWDGADSFHLISSKSSTVGGGDGWDTFDTTGDCSNSQLWGEAGNDDFAIGGPFKGCQVFGGLNDDILTGSGDWSGTLVSGQEGIDRLDCRACSGDITILGGSENDKLYGGSGDDWFDGGAGVDSMVGGAGDDYFYAVDGLRDIVDRGTHVSGDRADVDGDELLIRGVEFITYHL